MGRKKLDSSPFDDIEQDIREVAKSINILGNTINDREIQSRLKSVFDHLIIEAYRIRMLKDYTLTNSTAKILIQKNDIVTEASPAEILRAFIARWEENNKHMRYQEEDLWH